MPPDICPNCGTEVPANARACPECGADEETGWSEKAKYDSLGIPYDEFDYGEFTQREFGGKKPRRRLQTLWVIVAIILLLSGLIYLLRIVRG